MNLGLIVEGLYDVGPYRRWIRKIRQDVGELQARRCNRKIKDTFVRFLHELDRNPAWQIHKTIVIADSDCNPPNALADQLRNMLEGSAPSFPVHCFAIRCNLETWLLADEAAINEVAERRLKRGRIPRIDDPLETKDAKTRFHRALSMVELPADDRVYSEIAEHSRIDVLRQRCPQFRDFERLIHAC